MQMGDNSTGTLCMSNGRLPRLWFNCGDLARKHQTLMGKRDGPHKRRPSARHEAHDSYATFTIGGNSVRYFEPSTPLPPPGLPPEQCQTRRHDDRRTEQKARGRHVTPDQKAQDERPRQ
jgi:hypothetical protein